MKPFFKNVQQFGPDLPEGYPATIGLYDAWQKWDALKRNRIVIDAEDRIVSMIRDCALPPLDGFQDFHELPSAFEPTEDDRVRAEVAEKPPSLADAPPQMHVTARPLPVLAPV
jgi:hypothetical protein